MKKIAITTLNGYFNYGNRLQNYAVQVVLTSLGFDVETLIYEASQKDIHGKKKSTKSLIEVIKESLWMIKHKKRIHRLQSERTRVFKEFTSRYIRESKEVLNDSSDLESLGKRYDFFVTGSDQVWNPFYNGGSSFYFLQFAPQSKRVTFSPSFGISDIPENFVIDYQKYLNGFNHISVRENEGANLIQKLTKKEATILVDPTMCLTAEEWRSISKQAPSMTDKRYLLTYFLGGVPVEYRQYIRDLSDEYQLEIINLSDINDEVPYMTGPSEFISYIDRASLFCTDSFHGTVFSILLKTPFIVFDRNNPNGSMFSRVETLLKTFKLEHRVYSRVQHQDVMTVNFNHTEEILSVKRKEVSDFLKRSLQDQEKKHE